MATSTIKADATILHDCTITSGFNGVMQYVQIGRIVVLNGYINTTGAMSNGQVLATGLPNPAVLNNGGFVAKDNNSSTSGIVYVNGYDLRFAGTATSANRSWRIYGAYLASDGQ